jgi:hypothetical protein
VGCRPAAKNVFRINAKVAHSVLGVGCDTRSFRTTAGERGKGRVQVNVVGDDHAALK